MPVMFTSVGCGSTANTSDSAAIVDTTKPVITVSKKELSVAVGDEEWSKSVAKNFKVVDDTDGNLKEVEKIEDGKAGYVVDDDKVDPAKAGTYAVLITAVDSSGNKAKSSFSVKVTENKAEVETETESKETEKTESKSESSSSNSSVTNSNSASSSSASKNTGSSSSTPKPSTGGSSSGSGSAAKPSGGSGSSGSSGGSSGGSTPAPKPKPDCTTETIYHPAETHTVTHPAETTTVEHPAETRWFVDVPAHDEPIYEGALVCNTCGKAFLDVGEFDYHTLADDTSPCFLSSWHDDMVVVGTNHIPEQGHNEVVKQAWTETVVVKDAWTETVTDKEAWTETKEVCA